MLTFDWDFHVWEDPGLPYLRYGLGLGLSYADLSLGQDFIDAVFVGDPTNPNDDGTIVGVNNQIMFMFRPSASLRWELLDGALGVSLEAQYDMASHPLVINVGSDQDNSEDVVYSGFGTYLGIDYSF